MFRIIAPLSRFAISRCPCVQLLKYLRIGEKIKDAKLAGALQGQLELSVESTIKNSLLTMTNVATEQEYGMVIAAIDEKVYDQIFLFIIRITCKHFADILVQLVVPKDMLLPPIDIRDYRAIRKVFAHMIMPCVVEIYISSQQRLNGMYKKVELMTLYRSVATGNVIESVLAAKQQTLIMDIHETERNLEKQEMYFLSEGEDRSFTSETNFDDVLADLRRVGATLRQMEPYYICLRQVYEIRPNESDRTESIVRYLGCEVKELMTVDDRLAELTGAEDVTIVYEQGDSEVTAAEFALKYCEQSFLDAFRNVRVDTPPKISHSQ
ncbi:hypothetical protein HA402_006473 [Bradysia odoriphaga]|nr:hypothetical protein HA402_006473 [Bradysia odoriphaga]